MDKFTNLAIIELIEFKKTGNYENITKAQQLIIMIHNEVTNPDHSWRRGAV